MSLLIDNYSFLNRGSRPIGWLYSNQIQIDNTGNLSNLNDQVKITLNTSNFNFSLAKSDGSDFRFYNGTTLLNHWIESISIFSASIWVKVSGISAGSSKSITMYYGNSSATTTSSFANTMRRFQTSESNASYVVRFNDGSGSTSSNIGSAGGTMSIVGGKTWNANDIWSESTKSLTLDGSTGYVEKTGLLDSWGSSGSIHMSFTLNSTASDQTIFSKRNRALVGAGDDGDYVQLYFKTSNSKLTLKFSAGSSQKLILTGTTSLVTGKRYTVSLVWNSKLSDNFGGWMIVFLNGVRECDTFNVVSVPPSGSASSFRIGAMSNITTGAAESFASITINDFAYQTEQMYWAKICAVHEWRNYYQKDEKSKWVVSVSPDFGGAISYPSEPSMIYDGGKFVLYYSFFTGGQFTIIRKETTSILPNVTTTWTNQSTVLGHGVGGESGDALRGIVRKFGSTYYLYYRNGLNQGVINCVTSSDGISFGSKSVVLPIPGSGFGSNGGFYNCDVFLNADDGLYYMSVDGSDVSLVYTEGIYTCSTPNGTFTPYGTNPKTSMVPGTGIGVAGAPSINRVGNVIHNWVLGNPLAGALPDDIYRDYTASNDWNNWTVTGPHIIRERAHEYDQASDCVVLEVNGTSYIAYNGIDNGTRSGFSTFVSYICFAQFAGTLAQITADVTATISNPQTNVIVGLNPLVYYDNDPLYMASDGSSWIDRISGINLTGGGSGLKPAFTASLQNGRPGYVYDSNDVLSRTKLPIEGISGLTIIAAGQNICLSQDPGSNTNRINLSETGGSIFCMVDGVGRYASLVQTAGNAYYVMVFDGSLTGDANRLKLYYKGVQKTLTFNGGGSIPSVTGTNASSVFHLHNAAGGGQAGTDFEWAIVTRAINSTELANVHSFLAARYGL